jgi:hypothetical protein
MLAAHLTNRLGAAGVVLGLRLAGAKVSNAWETTSTPSSGLPPGHDKVLSTVLVGRRSGQQTTACFDGKPER